MTAAGGESMKSALRQARDELQALYDGSTEGILTVEADSQRFVHANRASCELLGYASEELLSLSVADIHPAESLPEVQAVFEAARQGRLKSARNIPCLRKDGQVIYVDVTMRLLTCGPKPLLLAFFRDITEQHRTIGLLGESESHVAQPASRIFPI